MGLKKVFPIFQVGFIGGICLPCYNVLVQVLPTTAPMQIQCEQNLDTWKQKAEERKKAEEQRNSQKEDEKMEEEAKDEENEDEEDTGQEEEDEVVEENDDPDDEDEGENVEE